MSTLVLAALLCGEPVTIHWADPVDPPIATAPAVPTTGESVDTPVDYGSDAVPSPEIESPPTPAESKLGANTTLFINFDGVHIGACNPSNSHENCNWLEKNTTFDPWSGSYAERVAVLDVIRGLAAEFGIRVTGRRPDSDEPYTMVVYGGDSVEKEALGRAPSGDCWNDLPNEIAYAYMDASRASWINGGGSTAFHEAAHTWGLDHVGLEGTLMAPSGGNTANPPFDGCGLVVGDVALTPAEETSCPDVNLQLCGLSGYQHDVATLRLLFGDPYVDDQAPNPVLVDPFDGVYLQGPVSFDVDIEIYDDLDPQLYEVAVVVPGLVDEPNWTLAHTADFTVESLPLGTWTFEVRVRDEAGNEGSLTFDVEIGEDPMALDDGCNCASPSGVRTSGWLGMLAVLLALPRSRRAKARRAPRVGLST